MSGATMRAVVARQLGPPESMALETVERPEPRAGQVRVRVSAAGVSFVDVLVASGGYQLKPRTPFTPGSEIAGVIDAVGDGVDRARVGQRVFASALGGAFADYAVTASQAAVEIPADMSLEDAAVFRVSYATAYYALVQRGRLEPGETMLVLGAGGAVGVAAVQVARALGGRVIASASTEAKRDLALACGAKVAIDSAAADWRDQIKALTGGRGVDVVIDPVGGPATELAFRSLAWNGRHLVIGFAQGEIPRLPTNLPLLKGGSLVGVDVRQFGEREPEAAAANLAALLALYAKGGLHPPIARRLPLEGFAEAMALAGQGSVAGRIVLLTGA